MKKSLAIMFLGMILFADVAWANLIAVSSVSITSQNTANKTANVQFNITWQNSWMNAVNNDAAWVFIKYSTDGGVTWAHATLAATGGSTVSDGGTGGILNPTGYSQGSGTALNIIVPTETTSGYTGAFLQRSANGTGTVTTTSMQFVWNWGADYLSNASSTAITASTTARVQVYAIEMVYIPAGSFYLGDGTSTSVTGQFCVGTTTTSPFQITSQAAMTLGGGGSNLGNNNASGMNTADDWNNSTTKSLPSTYPEGYNAFYIMKYPQTQGQYRDFLNTLTRTQQNNRVNETMSALTSLPTNTYVMSATGGASSAPSRNGIVVTAVPASTSSPMTFGCELNAPVNGSSDGEWVAMNYSYWPDAAAYAAWAGLRPFTEFEYEKASRGPSSVDTGTNGEYAWGSTTITEATSITNSGQVSEVAGQTGNGLCVYNSGTSGPMRVGMAAASTTTRAQAGASYYGALDMSGNVWQLIVTSGQSLGRGFTGSNGTGVLSSGTAGGTNDGFATNTDWPGYSGGYVSGETGSGLRGGSWNVGSTNERVSDRYFAAFVLTSRYSGYGARFARTSP